MIRWLAILCLAVLSWGTAGLGQTQMRVNSESLPALVFQYLDSADSDEAERLLQAVQRHPEASIERVIRIIETERIYAPRPIGTLADERIRVRAKTYDLALSIPLTYQPSKGYALMVCLHGAGFSGDAYLERWQPRLGEEYILACPTYPAGAWFTRGAEELVLATIRHVRQRYHIDPDRIFLTGMSNGGIGAWLIGMHHAPLFAGVAPMASGLDDVLISHDRMFLDRLATHILSFEGDSHVEWFEGNFADYEIDKARRLGADSVNHHRVKYKKLVRA